MFNENLDVAAVHFAYQQLRMEYVRLLTAFVWQREECERWKRAFYQKQQEKSITRIAPKQLQLCDEVTKESLRSVFASVSDLTSILKFSHLPNLQQLLSNEKFARLYRATGAIESITKMIGLTKAKDQIFGLVCYHSQMASNRDLNHVLIEGPTGCGKTELSARMASLLQSLGLVRKKDGIVSVLRKELLGKAQSSHCTQTIMNRCVGKILVVDGDTKMGEADYSSQCVNVFIDNLRRNREKMVCIFVKDSKDALFENEVMWNCFPTARRVTIEPFTTQELQDMFMTRAKEDGWEFSCDVSDIKKVFETFGSSITDNGWGVESLWNQTKALCVRRLMSTAVELVQCPTVDAEDIELACERCFRNKGESWSTLYV
jgi:hypothetical protein